MRVGPSASEITKQIEMSSRWFAGPRVKIGSLRKGERFLSISGKVWRFDRFHGTGELACTCRSEDDGHAEEFCANAEVIQLDNN